MKPGRELDALIAEKVMGHKTEMRLCANDNEIESLYDGDDPKSAYYKENIVKLKENYPQDIQPCIVHDVYFDPVPHYSTRIADAWLVHKEMMSSLFSIRRCYFKALQRIVSEPHDHLIAWPDVLVFVEPEHFCLAALEAVKDKT